MRQNGGLLQTIRRDSELRDISGHIGRDATPDSRTATPTPASMATR
ncbi:MAG TPA: hypothetical protein VLF41_01920 [Candidatus Nanoarchaeia archaeon]|nr:hypothetical protein [Candidatus Nanoarchaeia archaeon]